MLLYKAKQNNDYISLALRIHVKKESNASVYYTARRPHIREDPEHTFQDANRRVGRQKFLDEKKQRSKTTQRSKKIGDARRGKYVRQRK